jgi:hypothetical protein
MTVATERDVVDSYVQKMSEELLDDTTELWYIGRMVEFVKRKIISRNNNFNSINELVDWI